MALVAKHSRKSGMPPGSLVYVGEKAEEKSRISLISYGPDSFSENNPENWSDCESFFSSETLTWVNISGLGDSGLIAEIGESLKIHPLVLEDILNTKHRPKVEDHEDYVFMILKMIYRVPGDRWVTAEQVSVIFGRNYVISFQEVEGDVFEPIRERIRSGKGRLRKNGSDYLAYALMDATIDHCFTILEEIGDRIEVLQDKILQRAEPSTLKEIHHLKQMMVLLRKGVMPLREVTGEFQRLESPLISEDIGVYLRDAYEHTVQVIELTEMLRDLLSATLDTYMSVMSNRMNSTMQLLTVIATIFIPLTFLVGIYGMNFKYMPELGWRLGYPAVWGLIVLIGAGMAVYFHKKKIL